MSKNDEINARLDRLRADLAATNLAQAALMQTLPAAHREAWLKALAGLSALKADGGAPPPTPAMRTALRLAQEAEDRVYQGLQGAHRVQQAQERAAGGPA